MRAIVSLRAASGRGRAGPFAIGLALASLLMAATPAAAVVPGTSCPVLPADNIWNTDISGSPVNANSAAWLAASGGSSRLLHPDFGPSGDPSNPYGMPYAVVDSSHPKVNLTFQYSSESDHVPYPFGPDIPIEGGANSTGDRHALMIDRSSCVLYELYNAQYNSAGSTAGSGAVFDLDSNALRTAGWTSADAAGLPIFPGLLRLDEVHSGVINHAIRFTVQRTAGSYIWPARHQAGSGSASVYPPMGARFRMKGNVDISRFSQPTQVILTAFKRYGLIVADNGSNWFFQGEASNSWTDTLINELKSVPAGNFEAVDESALMVDPNSGRALQSGPPPPPTVSRLVAAVGGDGAVWINRDQTGWSSLGGSVLAAPAVVSVPNGGAGVPLVVALGADHDLWVRGLTSGWQRLDNAAGAYCIDNPAATVAGGTLTVVCQGGDHALWRNSGPVGPGVAPTLNVGNWTSAGGTLAAGPAIATVPGRGLDVMTVGANNTVSEYYGGSFHSTGFACTGHPALAANPGGSTAYFACRAPDATLQQARNDGSTNGGSWFGTGSLGGVLIDGPGLAVTSQGPTFYVEGADHAVWEHPASGWASDGGYVNYGAGAAALF